VPDYTYTVAFHPGTTPEPALEAIPGVKCWRGRWVAPWHAIPAVSRTCRQHGAVLSIIACPEDLPVPGAVRPWDAIQAKLHAQGEVRESYLTTWPLDYQKEALGFSAHLPGTLYHHPTGSGKTFTGIVWGVLGDGPLVIVTRAATRVQYAREVERFTNLRAFVCKPASAVRKKDKWGSLDAYLGWCHEYEQRPVIVVGWAALPSWADDLAEVLRAGCGSVIYDESHKGKSRKRWGAVPLPDRESPDYAKAVAAVERQGGKVKPAKDGEDGEEVGLVPLRNVAESASRLAQAAARRLETTATPIPDRVRDLWGQLDLLEPFAWGSYRTFAFRHCDAKPGQYGGLDDRGESRIPELDERLCMVKHTVSVAVARAALPPKRRQTWYIAPSEQVAPTGGWKRAIKAAQKRGPNAMLEIRLAMAASSKRRAIIQRIGECMESGQKVVVFTARKRDADEIAEGVRKLRGKSAATGGVWCGHGDHAQTERQKMLAGYVASEGACVLVGTGEAWGTGIDGLQCTDAAIFALLPYTPGQLDQWEGRFTRHGQDRPVTIYYPIAEGTADEHLASILIDKLPAVEALVGIESLEGAAIALAGTEHDPEVFAAGILASLRAAEGEDDD